ncbi:Methyltransferase domain protein [Candidatus Tiddalikarchaeum anstoanum]|nr:Methyltransferase domain protein [Candidatus Tiddalikarchaeum anstoanum]
MSSIQYNHPKIYDFLNFIINGKFNEKKFELISKIIGKDKRVLDLACGTGLLSKYIDSSCHYEGWDLNKKFIDYAKRRGINAKLKSIFDFKNYPKTDVIVIIDALHHVVPNQVKLLNETIKRSKQVIIVEPHTTFSIIPDFKELKSYKGIKRSVFSFLNDVFGDADGINPKDTVFDWNHDKTSLREFFKEHGAKKVVELGPMLIGVFEKS